MDAGHHPITQPMAGWGWRQSFYLALLAAALIYAVLVVVCPGPAAFCVAECELQLRPASSDSQAPLLSANEFALLCGLNSNGPPSSDAVRIETTSAGSCLLVRLTAKSESPRTALEMLSAAAKQFQLRAPAYFAARTGGYRDQPLTEHEEICWTALQEQLNKLVDCAEALMTEQSDAGGSAVSDEQSLTTSASAIDTNTELNPAWIQTNSELAAQRERLQKLLETRTPQHPEVQILRQNIERMAGRLCMIPLVAPADTPANEDESETLVDHEVPAPLSDIMANLRKDLGNLESAKAELKSAFENYATARNAARLQTSDSPVALWFAETNETPTLIERANGNGLQRHPELALIAVSSAVLISWWMRPSSSQILRSSAEAKQSWGAQLVAIFGDVPVAHGVASAPVTRQLALMVQWSVLILLALSLIWAASDRMFVGNFWHDPAMAIRDAWMIWGH